MCFVAVDVDVVIFGCAKLAVNLDEERSVMEEAVVVVKWEEDKIGIVTISCWRQYWTVIVTFQHVRMKFSIVIKVPPPLMMMMRSSLMMRTAFVTA